MKQKNERRKMVSLTLDQEVIELLNQKKKETGMSKSRMVENAVRQYISDEMKYQNLVQRINLFKEVTNPDKGDAVSYEWAMKNIIGINE